MLAGKLLGIPVRGTHAHSWVMFHGDELAAFRAYADAMPGNCTFLVDTYDTLEGVRNAIEVGQELRAQGHELARHPARLRRSRASVDRGARAARRGGLPERDDRRVERSRRESDHRACRSRARAIDVWGVGTKLVTAFDQPALGGVYKLGACRDAGPARGSEAIKLSEQPIKISNPGISRCAGCSAAASSSAT